MATITKTIDIKLTPQETAAAFCEMDAEDQCRFFNAIGANIGGWIAPFSVQLQGMIDTSRLSKEGRYVMQKIGEYANETSIFEQKPK